MKRLGIIHRTIAGGPPEVLCTATDLDKYLELKLVSTPTPDRIRYANSIPNYLQT